jgi:hypothetical protein
MKLIATTSLGPLPSMTADPRMTPTHLLGKVVLVAVVVDSRPGTVHDAAVPVCGKAKKPSFCDAACDTASGIVLHSCWVGRTHPLPPIPPYSDLILTALTRPLFALDKLRGIGRLGYCEGLGTNLRGAREGTTGTNARRQRRRFPDPWRFPGNRQRKKKKGGEGQSMRKLHTIHHTVRYANLYGTQISTVGSGSRETKLNSKKMPE